MLESSPGGTPFVISFVNNFPTKNAEKSVVLPSAPLQVLTLEPSNRSSTTYYSLNKVRQKFCYKTLHAYKSYMYNHVCILIRGHN